ncbi:hypothetical protein F0A16_02745 [Salinicola corii]|uniref:Uncharacterized protein n=1 Tax=Salinicola corii TaxID=2606937 RepID=A0A640WJE6_9GAMM|nr:hypothetical protein [Salinicola corii]KAA0020724.1 hypothetical protein F0A16_02745 [Salinicola corii]
MAKYRAARNLFVDNVFVDEGAEFKSNGKPGKHWIPLDAVPNTPAPSESSDGAIYADGPVEEIDGKHYAAVEGLMFEVDPRNVRDDLSLTNAGVSKYEAAKAE